MSELSHIDINNVDYNIKDAQSRSDINSLLAASVVSGSYNSTNHTIELKNSSNVVVSTISAEPFIKDGMVSSVAIVNGNLVITFNTDAGKAPIAIPLTEIFDPSNYYNKNVINSIVGYFECDTASNSASKTVSAIGYTFVVGGSIKIKMLNANSANSVTLNINSTGAKPLFYGGQRAGASNTWEEGETVEVYYDGTNYYANNVEGVRKQVLDDINERIDELYAAEISVRLSIIPSTIYKGVDTQINLTGTMSGGTPTSMKLMDGDTQLKSSSSSPITHSMTVNLSESSKTYKVVGVSMGRTFNSTSSVSARYPLYYGFGANAAAVAIDANKYSPTTTAIRTYTKTATTNGQHFYLLVPNDITPPSSFVMGGAPFVMNRSTQTINGISYVVFESGNAYNSGTELKIIAA